MQEEAAQELVDRQSNEPLLVGVRGVSPAEGNVALFEGNQPAVGDRNAMGVRAEITQGMFGAAERGLGIGHPVVTEQQAKPCGEAAWFGQACEVAIELEPTLVESGPQLGNELASENAAKYLHGQKERVPRRNPAGMVGSEASGGCDAVDMRMMMQTLVPGMQHAEEAYLYAEVTRIASDLDHGCGAGLEE